MTDPMLKIGEGLLGPLKKGPALGEVIAAYLTEVVTFFNFYYWIW